MEIDCDEDTLLMKVESCRYRLAIPAHQLAFIERFLPEQVKRNQPCKI